MPRRFDKRDFAHLEDFICEELKSRKAARKDREKIWNDIDRQLAMTPDKSYKLDAQGRPDPQRAWMPETELPGQAQTLEVLTADSRRMKFPDSGPWFAAHSEVTDKYLNQVDLQSLITGDENDVPSRITQDNVDKLVQGTLNHWHRQYDFEGFQDQIDAEAFKYGVGIGRGRLVTAEIIQNAANGVKSKRTKIPVLFPRSIKNVYLDCSQSHLMNEGHLVGKSIIAEYTLKWKDLSKAAKNGKSDPKDEDGGWMPARLAGLSGDDKGQIKLIEFEGDLVVPRATTRSIYLPNVIVTVIGAQKEKTEVRRIIRLRQKKESFLSYLEFPYHQEDMSGYATSPLMKGHPIQVAAVDALNKALMASALQVQPPLGYDSDEPEFSQKGGLNIYPGAQWPTTGEVRTYDFGDPSALFAAYTLLINQYFDVTGVNAPRLGAQTVSHTTAFAKNAELTRGTIRTVDYVKSTLKGPMTQWLYMAYQMGRNHINESVYIDAYGGFVDVDKDALPEKVVFDVFGAGGPAEEQAKSSARLQSMQLALQIDQAAAQMAAQGTPTTVNPRAAIEQILHEGKWSDVDAVLNPETTTQGPPAQPGMGSTPGIITSNPSDSVEAFG